MRWLDDYLLVIRGTDGDDPFAEGYAEAMLACARILPNPVLYGEVTELGSGRLEDRIDVRLEFLIKSKPITTLANRWEEYQSFGHYWQLAYKVMPKRRKFIVQALKIGSDPASGVIPRARLNPTTGLVEDTFWQTEVPLPVEFVLDGTLSLQPRDEEGVSDLEFKILKAIPEDFGG